VIIARYPPIGSISVRATASVSTVLTPNASLRYKVRSPAARKFCPYNPIATTTVTPFLSLIAHIMLSKLGTKIALHKAGLGDVKLPTFPKSEGNGKDGNAGAGFQNPFANVQWGAPKAFASWKAPPAPSATIREPPAIGDRAQSNVKLKFPAIDGRPCIVLFLRYCGCPCES